MFRVLITILFLLVSVSFAAEQLVLTKYDIVELVDKEDATYEFEKSKEDFSKEKFFHNHLADTTGFSILISIKPGFRQVYLPQGFIDKPFTPPDFS